MASGWVRRTVMNRADWLDISTSIALTETLHGGRLLRVDTNLLSLTVDSADWTHGASCSIMTDSDFLFTTISGVAGQILDGRVAGDIYLFGTRRDVVTITYHDDDEFYAFGGFTTP